MDRAVELSREPSCLGVERTSQEDFVRVGGLLTKSTSRESFQYLSNPGLETGFLSTLLNNLSARTRWSRNGVSESTRCHFQIVGCCPLTFERVLCTMNRENTGWNVANCGREHSELPLMEATDPTRVAFRLSWQPLGLLQRRKAQESGYDLKFPVVFLH